MVLMWMWGVYRVHFIPLSSSYKELYNIHAYFSGPTPSTIRANFSSSSHPPSPNETSSSPVGISDEEIAAKQQEWRDWGQGDRRLRRIARAGKNWKKTVGRREDMEGALHYSSVFLLLGLLTRR
jgi:hypothetical protein